MLDLVVLAHKPMALWGQVLLVLILVFMVICIFRAKPYNDDEEDENDDYPLPRS